jgi:hypothetical protein
MKTNCVDNGTGLTAETATAGLISGVTSTAGTFKGRLDAAGDSVCNRSLRSVIVNGVSKSTKPILINDDTLSCFFNNDQTQVQDIALKDYKGGPVVDCRIFDSPRFFYQPVLQVRPGKGGSDHYSIIDFRPAFISQQDATATRNTGPTDSNTGVTIDNGSLTQLDVTFFNPKALPDDCPNGFGPGLGGTTKTELRLVN